MSAGINQFTNSLRAKLAKMESQRAEDSAIAAIIFAEGKIADSVLATYEAIYARMVADETPTMASSVRAVVSDVNLPSFAFDSSNFSTSNLNVYALVVDYFFAPSYLGFWIGGGFENWAGKVYGRESGSSR